MDGGEACQGLLKRLIVMTEPWEKVMVCVKRGGDGHRRSVVCLAMTVVNPIFHFVCCVVQVAEAAQVALRWGQPRSILQYM